MSRYVARDGEAREFSELVRSDISDLVLDAYASQSKAKDSLEESRYKGQIEAYHKVLQYWNTICKELEK